MPRSTCAGTSWQRRAREFGWRPKRKNPARVDHFHIDIEVPAQLDEVHRAGVEEAVHHCLIHNTLLHPPQMEFAIKSVAQ
jgi:hypothetical protein